MQNTQNNPLSLVVYILAWLVCSVLVIACVLLVRQATLDVMTAYQMEQIENSAEGEQARARITSGFVKEIVDRGMIILGAVAAISLAIYFEYYFRKGREQGKLYQRIGKVVGILAAVLVVAVIIQTLV